MIRMDKMEITAYRYLGGAGACFTAFQGFVWLLLYLVGAICKFTECGASGAKHTFKYCFYLIYYYDPSNITTNFTRINYIHPTSFHIIMWLNVLTCALNIVISVLTVRAFIQWTTPKTIRKMAFIWTRCILIFCVWELVMFCIFASDVASIQKNNDIKCFTSQNLSSLKTYSSYLHERTPAPYLLQLKSNLLTIRKKLRKYKRNLLLLDASFDEKSPDHVRNPFISKSVVNSYVEDIWKSMFNNSIREKVRRKYDGMPFDEVMRDFIIGHHLDLDDMDYDLLNNFDGLTNNKWIRPIKSSNVVFGKQFNLSSSITKNESESAELDKIKKLLNEYLKDTDVLTNFSQPDQNLDGFFEKILDDLEDEVIYYAQSKDENKNATLDKVESDTLEPYDDNDEILLKLRTIFDSIVSQEEDEDTLSNQTMQIVTNKIKEFLENNKVIEFTSDDQIFNNITDFLKFEHDINQQDSVSDNKVIFEINNYSLQTTPKLKERKANLRNMYPDLQFRANPPPKSKEPKKNPLVLLLCKHCFFFILAPSIVCMVLSLKIGLIWVLNIIVAVLVMYYGSIIELKIRYKCLPCFSKKE